MIFACLTDIEVEKSMQNECASIVLIKFKVQFKFIVFIGKCLIKLTCHCVVQAENHHTNPCQHNRYMFNKNKIIKLPVSPVSPFWPATPESPLSPFWPLPPLIPFSPATPVKPVCPVFHFGPGDPDVTAAPADGVKSEGRTTNNSFHNIITLIESRSLTVLINQDDPDKTHWSAGHGTMFARSTWIREVAATTLAEEILARVKYS